MRRESHVRFCESGGVRFPSATRRIWERRTGAGRNVTFPARQCAINGERRTFALLRPTADPTAQAAGPRSLKAHTEAEAAATTGE